MNPVKTALAKAMVRRSAARSDFDPDAAERNLEVDHSVPEYNNSYYFSFIGDEKAAVITRLAGRGNGAFELWFSAHVPGQGLFSVPETAQAAISSFESAPLSMECVEPQRTWRLVYEGPVLNEKGKTVDAEFRAELRSEYPIFHFTNDMDPAPMARAIAGEKWSAEFFRTLARMHQHHYEQGGEARMLLNIGRTKLRLSAGFFRDHSFGPRSWNAMDRHIWLSGRLSNGDVFNLSLPEYPFIKIRAGFYGNGGTYRSVVGSTPFLGIVPDRGPAVRFEFHITLDDGRGLTGRCVRGPGFSWLMDGVYRVHEWVSDFEIEGVRGTGICEFGYNVKRFDHGF